MGNKKEGKDIQLEKAYPAVDIVKGDVLDDKRSIKRWFSIYKLYSPDYVGLNEACKDRYFNRVVSEILRLYDDMRVKFWVEDKNKDKVKRPGYETLFEIEDYLLGKKKTEPTKEEWIKYWHLLVDMVEETGITKIEMSAFEFEEGEG